MRVNLNVMRARFLSNDWEGVQAVLSEPGKIVLSSGDRSLSRDTHRAYQMLFRAYLKHGFILDPRPFSMHRYNLRVAEVIAKALSKSVSEYEDALESKGRPAADRSTQLVNHVASCLISGGFDQKKVSNMLLTAGLSKRQMLSAPVFGLLAEEHLLSDLGM